jgi:hypothetical protein
MYDCESSVVIPQQVCEKSIHHEGHEEHEVEKRILTTKSAKNTK